MADDHTLCLMGMNRAGMCTANVRRLVDEYSPCRHRLEDIECLVDRMDLFAADRIGFAYQSRVTESVRNLTR